MHLSERNTRVGLSSGEKERVRGWRDRERAASLGAGRPMWLGRPLFVFPTQSDMTGAISTPSHSQGPLSANFPPAYDLCPREQGHHVCLCCCRPHMISTMKAAQADRSASSFIPHSQSNCNHNWYKHKWCKYPDPITRKRFLLLRYLNV